MVDKTKRALSILQQRNAPASTSPSSLYKTPQTNHNNGSSTSLSGNGTGISSTGHPYPSLGGSTGRLVSSNFASTMADGLMACGSQNGIQFNLAEGGGTDPLINRSKFAVSDMLAATLRSTEERVVEVRRRAEEAVLEVTT